MYAADKITPFRSLLSILIDHLSVASIRAVNVLCNDDRNPDWDAVIKLLLFRYSYNCSNISFSKIFATTEITDIGR